MKTEWAIDLNSPFCARFVAAVFAGVVGSNADHDDEHGNTKIKAEVEKNHDGV